MKKLCLMLTAALLLVLCACTSEKQADLQPETPDISESAVSWNDLTFDRTLPLSYATRFSVSYAGDDYTRITIGSDQEFLLVAENAETPEGVPASVTVLHQPLSHIYLVASAAMDYFDHLDAVDRISLSGLKTGDWYIESAKAAMEAGSMRYAGKYSAPDYEAILESGCDLAIENTMIYHTPEVIEQLQTTGVPVLVERSSYESEKRTWPARSMTSSLPRCLPFSIRRQAVKPSHFSTSIPPARSMSANRGTTSQRPSRWRAGSMFRSTKAARKTRCPR